MPDFNKGDFTQQGVAGHVNANIRLNEKRLVNIDLTSNEEAEGCTISGAVTDLLNNEVYPIGAGVSGNIEITENGENINVAPYATASVNVSGGGGDTFPHCKAHAVNNTENSLTLTGVPYDTGILDYEITLQPNESIDMVAFYFEQDDEIYLSPTISDIPVELPEGGFSDLNNLTLEQLEGVDYFWAKVTDPTATSSCTVDARFFEPRQ